jgi:hypothetical protein
MAVEDGRLAAGRLADLRAAGRDFGAADRGRDEVDLGRLGVVRAEAPVPLLASTFAPLARVVVPAGLAARVDEVRADELRADVPRAEVPRDDVPRDDVPRDDVPRVEELRDDELRDDGRVDDARDDGRVDVVRRLVDGLRALVVRPAVRLVELAGATLADDIVLAAAVSAFAAVIMAFVAVFIDFIADDIVWADAVALVAAAVILVAADVTLVAAEDTPRAAVAGVAELRVPRLVVLLRAVLEPERDAVDRDAVLPVDRDPALRVLALATVPPAVLALLRVDLDVVPDVLEAELDLGRPAVPLDALRLTDLLRAVLAELRRGAARVVD